MLWLSRLISHFTLKRYTEYILYLKDESIQHVLQNADNVFTEYITNVMYTLHSDIEYFSSKGHFLKYPVNVAFFLFITWGQLLFATAR